MERGIPVENMAAEAIIVEIIDLRDFVTVSSVDLRYTISNRKGTDEKEFLFMKYVCEVCGWVYDEEQGYPEGGIAPGTKWEDVPEDFECPLCSVGKDQFSEE